MNCRYGDIKVASAVDTGAILILSYRDSILRCPRRQSNQKNSDPPGVFHAGRIVLKPDIIMGGGENLWENTQMTRSGL